MSVRAGPHTHYQEGIKDSLKVICAHVLYAIYNVCLLFLPVMCSLKGSQNYAILLDVNHCLHRHH